MGPPPDAGRPPGPEAPPQWIGPEDGFQFASGPLEPAAMPGAFTCNGPGKTPPFRFRNVPEEAVALAIVAVDLDADTAPALLWQISGLLPETEAFEGDAIPPEAVEGDNASGGVGYQPPCGADGEEHRIAFTVFALSEQVDPPPFTDTASVLAAYEEAAIASVERVTVVQGDG